ncbi:MAG: hypothetical protein M3Q98_03725 [Actinomycetota bacterium]|nr:hypothetical protein [Actinomycetota bacterium]
MPHRVHHHGSVYDERASAPERERIVPEEAGDVDPRSYYRAAPSYRELAEYRHRKFGGFNGSAVFYGWLVAVALTGLLAGVVGVAASVIGSDLDVTTAQVELRAGTMSVSLVVAVVLVLMVGYYVGGYVAGRLARFDGARQGFGVWAWGVLITVVMVAFGEAFGQKYNIFERADLPSFPTPEATITTDTVTILAAVLAGTFLAAVLGGKRGERFHTKIDQAVL